MEKPTPDDRAFVRSLVREQSGMVLGEDKQYLIDARLRALAQEEALNSIHELAFRLRTPSESRLRRSLVEQLLVGETYFFRDGHPFEALRSTILPALLAARVPDTPLNLWCAAASTGQEPYSLAMLLADSFPDLWNGSVRLFATDLSDAHLARARAGLYSDMEVARGLPEALRARYSQREGDGYRMHAALRRRIEFAQLNLIRDWPTIPTMDLVLMRNVLVYFDSATRTTILQKLRRVMRPGGYLLLGTTETLIEAVSGFAPLRVGPTVFYQRERQFGSSG